MGGILPIVLLLIEVMPPLIKGVAEAIEAGQTLYPILDTLIKESREPSEEELALCNAKMDLLRARLHDPATDAR